MELEDGEPVEQDKEQYGVHPRWTTLAEGVDVIILIRKRQRRRGYSVHTSGGGGLPDLISFISKLARTEDLFYHQFHPNPSVPPQPHQFHPNRVQFHPNLAHVNMSPATGRADPNIS